MGKHFTLALYLSFTYALRSLFWILTFLWHSLSKLIKMLHSSVCKCGDKSGCIFRRMDKCRATCEHKNSLSMHEYTCIFNERRQWPLSESSVNHEPSVLLEPSVQYKPQLLYGDERASMFPGFRDCRSHGGRAVPPSEHLPTSTAGL